MAGELTRVRRPFPPGARRARACWLAIGLTAAAPAAHAQGLRERLLAAEHHRAATAADLAFLRQGLRSRDAGLAAQAVRALGRVERPELVEDIVPLATHAQPAVRAEALNALGQSLAAVARHAADPLPPQAAAVTRLLLARMRADPDPYVAGVAAETLGRLPYRTPEAITVAADGIAALLPPPRAGAGGTRPRDLGRSPHPALLAGAVQGAEALIRVYGKVQAPSGELLARLRVAASHGAERPNPDLAYVRRVAWLALTAARAADPPLIAQGLGDPDDQVRRHAAVSLADAEAGAERDALLARALADRSPFVRYEAVRVHGRGLPASGCAPLMKAVDDENAHVALAAIDALGRCPAAAPRLEAVAGELRERSVLSREDSTLPRTWHRPARAIVSLARVRPEAAAARLEPFAHSDVWQVRMYAARAAALLEPGILEALAADPHDNVREAAIAGLAQRRGHEADHIYIDALGRADYQLVITAARALAGTPNAARAVPALQAALARITAHRRDTARDARAALVERLQELGADAADAHVPQRTAAPERVPPYTRARITMARGGSVDLRLFPQEAPATVARVARLALDGYYNGLTFHRVVPNFVLQGGSPGANEYMGDGPFMRDELGLRGHRRGTLGISTRGRDTGDAQIFVNLLDNPRLDHNYTIFAEVTAGMHVLDAILEGDVIERFDVFEPGTVEFRR